MKKSFQQCHGCSAGRNQPWFWLGSGRNLLSNFRPVAVPRRHGMPKISHTEPPQHCDIITHWTHVEEMKWFSSVMLGVLTANNLGCGLAVEEICCQTLGQQQCHGGMTYPKSATQSLTTL
jgi:hypothetical protein